MEYAILPLIIIVPALVTSLILNRLSLFSERFNFAVSGFLGGVILGQLFADSMHFPNLIFSWLYFGMIGAFMGFGLLNAFFPVNKKTTKKFFYSSVGIFITSLIVLFSVFYSLGGVYSIIAPHASLNFILIWIVNFIFLGLISGVLRYLERYVKIKK